MNWHVLRRQYASMFLTFYSKKGGGRNFERPNVEQPIFRNLKIADKGQNFKQ